MTCPRLGRGLLLCVGLLASAGCEGTEVGNPVEQIQLSLSLSARSSNDEVALEPEPDAGTAPIAVDELWVSLGDVRFVLDQDCSGPADTRTTIPGPIIGELTAAPTVLSARLPNDDYCSVRVSLERAGDSDASTPEDLVGYSVMVKGRRYDGLSFRIRSRDKPDFVLHSNGAPFRLAGDEGPLFLAFDVGAWLADVDLAAAVPNADGDVLIEPGVEAPLLRQFETNLRTSLSLFKDANKDGAIDSDEAAAPLAL